MVSTWKAAKSADWSDPDNWDGGVPTTGADIVFPPRLPGPSAPRGFQAGSLSVEGTFRGGPMTVTGGFRWTDGNLACPIVLPAGATGQVTVGGGDMALLAAITNAGTLTLDGRGTLPAGNDAVLTSSGRLTLGDGIALEHTGGAHVEIRTTGVLRVAAPLVGAPAGFTTSGGVVTVSLDAGTVQIDGTLVVGRGTTLWFRGADVTGAGSIRATASAVVEVAATTVLDEGLDLHIQDATLKTSLGAPVNTRLHIDGTLAVEAGSVFGRALHIRPPGSLRLGPSTTAWFQSDVVITNDGVLDVPAGTTWNLPGEATLDNRGVTTVHAGATLNGGRITNTGLLEIVGDGTVRLANSELVNAATPLPSDVEPRVGAIVVRSGTLRLEGLRTFAIDDGGLYLAGGRLECVKLRVDGGCLTGSGTVRGTVVNNGWLDLGQAGGWSVDGDLECGAGGHLVVPATAWDVTGAGPLLTVTGRATLAGSVWAPQAPGDPPLPPRPLHLLQARQVLDGFERRRAASWEARLRQIVDQTATPATVDLVVERAPEAVFYGFDLSVYLDIRQRGTRPPAAHRAAVDGYMGAAYENTPWSSFVMYVRSPTKPTAGFLSRRTEDALASLAVLLEQGWGILPVYWGRNNAVDPLRPNPDLTAAQGRLDADDAVACAQGTRAGGGSAPPIPAGRVVYLDIESATATDPQQRARDYVDAWIDRMVAIGTYSPGVYCPHDFAQGLQKKYPDLPLWVAQPRPRVVPVDPNHDITAIDFSEQDVDCTVWQYRLDVAPPDADVRFVDDHGNRVKWEGPAVDFDLARCLDPSRPRLNGRKTPRSVTGLTLEPPSVTGGDATEVVITLDRAAPRPLGTALVLRASKPEAQVPATVWVGAGQSSVTVPVSTSRVGAAVPVEIIARGMHQLDTEPQRRTLMVNPRS